MCIKSGLWRVSEIYIVLAMGGFRPEDCRGKVKEGGKAAIVTRLNAHWNESLAGADHSLPRIYSRVMSLVELGNWDALCEDEKALNILFNVVEEVVPGKRKLSLG